MTPRELVETWVERFNARDPEGLAELYHDDAIDDQLPDGPVAGRAAVADRFRRDFANQDMTCHVDGIHEVGDIVVLEWTDPIGLVGCSFFTLKDGQIIHLRGYWDKLTAMRLHGQSSEQHEGQKS